MLSSLYYTKNWQRYSNRKASLHVHILCVTIFKHWWKLNAFIRWHRIRNFRDSLVVTDRKNMLFSHQDFKKSRGSRELQERNISFLRFPLSFFFLFFLLLFFFLFFFPLSFSMLEKPWASETAPFMLLHSWLA